MVLDKLEITRNASWEARPGELKGKIKFVGGHGEIVINLDHEMSNQILTICAASVVHVANQVANDLTAETITQVPALAAP